MLDPDGQPWAALSAAAPSFTCSLEEYVAHTAVPVMKAAETMAKILRISGSPAVPGTA